MASNKKIISKDNRDFEENRSNYKSGIKLKQPRQYNRIEINFANYMGSRSNFVMFVKQILSLTTNQSLKKYCSQYLKIINEKDNSILKKQKQLLDQKQNKVNQLIKQLEKEKNLYYQKRNNKIKQQQTLKGLKLFIQHSMIQEQDINFDGDEYINDQKNDIKIRLDSFHTRKLQINSIFNQLYTIDQEKNDAIIQKIDKWKKLISQKTNQQKKFDQSQRILTETTNKRRKIQRQLAELTKQNNLFIVQEQNQKQKNQEMIPSIQNNQSNYSALLPNSLKLKSNQTQYQQNPNLMKMINGFLLLWGFILFYFLVRQSTQPMSVMTQKIKLQSHFK